jgi:hypothetical protein
MTRPKLEEIGEQYAGLTSKERKYIATMQKRLAWIRKRSTEALTEQTYDKQEIAALEWALGKIAMSTRTQ